MITSDTQKRVVPLLTRWGENALASVQDLMTLSALSSSWMDKDWERIATDAVTALAGILNLEFAAVKLSRSSGQVTFRHSLLKGKSSAIFLESLPQMNYPWPISGVADWQSSAGGSTTRIARIPIGLNNDGWLFACSTDAQFPKDSEFVILSNCASQIAIALQDWRGREKDKRLWQFAEHSADVLWILDANVMQMEYLSPAFARIWGQAPAAVLGEMGRWIDTIHPDDRVGALAALDSVLSGEVVVQHYRIVRPDLVIRRIRQTLFPIRDAQGRIQHVGGAAEDVTKPANMQVYVLNTDTSSRRRLSHMLQRNGYGVTLFTSTANFLGVAPVLVPGCVILVGESAEAKVLRIVSELRARRIDLPVIVLGNGLGEVSLVVKAMKAGVTDWLEAPHKLTELLAAIASALAGVQDAIIADQASELARIHIAEMTPREREVLLGLVAGETGKLIARRLGISPRTVELHRARVMERLGARTLSEAVFLAASAGLKPQPDERPGKPDI
ncbi:PAS domain S-box protein [Rhizobium acidisoli]|uniref:PAS domain S-box protein n=2 Tax=Rhizobium acidisoli TaxID=1538158 RepID=A0AAE5TXK7_9HYPH|nr:PAS domain S-box protein [Rhizobium acidisoli]